MKKEIFLAIHARRKFSAYHFFIRRDTNSGDSEKQRKGICMKNEEKKKIYGKPNNAHNLKHLHNAIDHTRPASPNDCTGYTPVMPLSAEESESYEDLMELPAPGRYRRHNEDM